jgi:hypothetical protein
MLRRNYYGFKPNIILSYLFKRVRDKINTVLKMTKYEKDKLVDEIRLKANSLQKKKRRRAILFSITRAGSTLLLFLSFILLQYNFSIYLFSVIVCLFTLGITVFLEE